MTPYTAHITVTNNSSAVKPTDIEIKVRRAKTLQACRELGDLHSKASTPRSRALADDMKPRLQALQVRLRR